MPSLDMVRRNTTVRIDPLIEATPALRELVVAPRSRDAGNSLSRKSFPGGQLVMTGANPAVGLRSTPVRRLCLDEVEGPPGDVDAEVDLAIRRTATFRGRCKIYMVSTPTLKGRSLVARIQRLQPVDERALIRRREQPLEEAEVQPVAPGDTRRIGG